MTTDKPPSRPRTLLYRPWQAGDSAQAVTALLHRAFDPLAQQGLTCASGRQPAEATLARIEQGWCFVAEDGGRIVGTLTVYASEPESSSRVYRNVRVASVHQFAVEPAYQGAGVGDALLRLAACAAKRAGFAVLALDTPKRAKHLLAFYRHHGFRVAESLRFAGRDYTSLVLEKPLRAQAARLPATAWL
ncbi:MAG: GNAT family N-acetyltransferase [Paludibacterium sp.]|uniref:GNAT family N-acetyltransferase n=1 Tax=Paludibacterium sp. TaxID=1917523 RepID=UPI0025EC9286|nr:GNAT family N-acetyltransferase [Paludibacterium sp.]MBV8045768.1 GNAT family N-acetyltransferase [Paludibacterium sp.]MBV8649248.1 GNAT family N-acetyltransferase [Paludibacterium sp.]